MRLNSQAEAKTPSISRASLDAFAHDIDNRIVSVPSRRRF